VSALELADIYIVNKNHLKAEKLLLRILDLDQYNEDACLGLIRLYTAASQRSRAVKFHASFVDRFTRDLGIKPCKELASAIDIQD
jgi:DNA-binding SARP family transcriptional activator